jgi:hypothetical protein
MPSNLNSFISPAIFRSESKTLPLYAGMLAGSTYVAPTFNGASGAASNDPGGLFGWLIYARSQVANPTRGYTYDPYIEYTNYNSLINDLNLLGGITYCLISRNTEGGTFGFFSFNASSAQPNVTARNTGNDFIHALNYLSYGGTLVIAGTCAGFVTYQNTTTNLLDVMIGQSGFTNSARFLENNDYIVGIFPSVNDGAGYTALNFDSLFSSSANVVFTEGATVADRIFNVGGQSKKQFSTESLRSGTSILYTISSVADAAGAFARSKDQQDLPFTVAGINYSIPLNTTINNIVLWEDITTKNIYKKNRVNFYSKTGSGNNVQYFIGSDLVGATAGASDAYTAIERIGPAYLRNTIEKTVREIMLKYLYNLNNASTRASVTTEITLYIQSLTEYLDSTFTQIVCNGINNVDNSTTLNAEITVKPLTTTESFTFSVSIAT